MKYTLPFDLPQLPDFREYIIFDGFLPHEVDRINAMWIENEAKKATVTGNTPYQENLRKSTVFFLEPTERNHWVYERITTLAGNCNAQRYGFDLTGFVEPLQLAQYQPGEFFDWHMDFSAGEASNRKLSVTVQLSDEDDYEGGELQFMINNRTEIAPRRKGSLVVFPSFIQHRVTEVTSGKRHSMAGWLAGPPYR